MDNTPVPGQGWIRFLIMLIAILLLLTFAERFTWNRVQEEQSEDSRPGKGR